jgi:methylenetetrahydrofolate reductase (NADPH)
VAIADVRDEAFELGCQWATLYPEGSPSRALIENVMNTSYLVNIVANDFKDGSNIFEPFVLDQSNVVTGVKDSVAGLVNGAVEGVKGLLVNGRVKANGVTNGHNPATNGH